MWYWCSISNLSAYLSIFRTKPSAEDSHLHWFTSIGTICLHCFCYFCLRNHSKQCVQSRRTRVCAMKPSATILKIDFTVRNWARSCYVIRIRKIPDLASTRFRIHSGLKKYPRALWREYSESSGFASEFTGEVWVEDVSGKKKLRIQKYPDTCGRSLSNFGWKQERRMHENRWIVFRELKHARFWDADGNRKWVVFPFNLSLHNHIYIAKYLFPVRND